MSDQGLSQSWSPRPSATTGSSATPSSPASLEETGVPVEDLRNLVLKLASTVPSLSAESAAVDLCLPMGIVASLLELLCEDHSIESLGSAGRLTYRYAITDRGRERAKRLFEICGYVGPAPVSLEDYGSLLEQQFAELPPVTPEKVAESMKEMVLPEEIVEMIGLACLSGRTLLLHGPPGNGKTEVGRKLHGALEGDLWIPYCIGVHGNVIRLFDPQVHRRVPVQAEAEGMEVFDRRWVRIRRPFVVIGGELTLDALELAYDEGQRCYEAPMHVKANGGTFLLDDFGCQRAEPNQLLGRWVYPLEHQEDHLAMSTGQKIQVPFKQFLVVSTNLDPEEFMDPAFLRRMGYRVYLGDQPSDRYRRIFERYAENLGVAVSPLVLDELVERYRREERRMRGCEPRDLIERTRDFCSYRNLPLALDAEALDRAWKGYFGDTTRTRDTA